MKNHLKRIMAPKTWILARQENTFTIRPNAGGHSLEFGLPLGLLLRDHLKLASTANEAKKILDSREVLIDGKRRKDHRFSVGLFDVLSIPEIKKYYRLVLDQKGRMILAEISAAESGMKVCKITGKTALSGSKIQFNLHDGKNIIANADIRSAKVGDSFVVDLPSLKIKEVLPLKIGSIVFLMQGKYRGDIGVLKKIKEKEAIYDSQGKEVKTARKYFFVIGDKNAVISMRR